MSLTRTRSITSKACSVRDRASHVPESCSLILLAGCFQALKLPLIVYACKSDSDRAAHSGQVHTTIKKLDVGLVEVSAFDEEGKARNGKGFHFLLRAISTQRASLPSIRCSAHPW